jgi:type II secretory pathway predicted ATPase ExeA
MYESYYGFTEKPFSLTPDPKYLYRSESHANAFDLLQYAVSRREGFAVVTGDIGTGKTTLCRALLETIDRNTFTALVLNPFLTEQDLLKRILQDFGVISRDEVKAGRLAAVTKQDLIETLYDFLLSLIRLKASAVLIIDEAQNLPLSVLEQIRILSNLETNTEKLLQIILVGQLELQTLLRSPELRQLDQRVSIRYELKPLDRESVAAYVSHRLTVAGGHASVQFTPKALAEVHRWSNGIPRLINLICDRALLAGYSIRSGRITDDMVIHAVRGLDVQQSDAPRRGWLERRTSLAAAASLALTASAIGVGATALVYQRFDAGLMAAARAPETRDARSPERLALQRELPADAAFTILVSSYPLGDASTPSDVDALTRWLEAAQFRVFHVDLDLGSRGRWRRVLAGAYADVGTARRDAIRLKSAAPAADPQLLDAAAARGIVVSESGVRVDDTRARSEP